MTESSSKITIVGIGDDGLSGLTESARKIVLGADVVLGAEATLRLLADLPGRKVLVTSDYHMYRAIRVFRKAGIEIQPWPFPDVRKRYGYWMNRWSCVQDLAVETVKIVYYYAHGWI